MLHTTIGSIGHLSTIISFVATLLSVIAYFKATQTTEIEQHQSWKSFARIAFYVHVIAVLGIIASLFGIIYNHYFEYHYAWQHSSRALPVYYIISCFWEGQEGSFLLWIFWHAVLGLILIKTNSRSKQTIVNTSTEVNKNFGWETPVMFVFALVQAFLCSMILGVIVPGFDIKIGSSPFLLLKEAMPNLPVWAMKPNFIPEDGNGLNPLLQNYWMVIHPPTLFLGFATTLIPFAFAMAGLWKKNYSNWIRPALPWALISALILGVGIIMGGYWAYETLNFGGYWNWDPVENASFVPWLILVAAYHCMIIYKNSETALRASFILVVATFILVLYSTFLNRSGVLGNASVHSFTDLGLSGQLLIYLFTFLLAAVFLLAIRWKYIPTNEKEISAYSREFWIFLGATTLCLSAFQIITTTSIPVYNKIAEAFGFVSNMAMPVDQPAHYSKFQLWFGLAIAFFSGLGQFFWWKKINPQNLAKYLLTPFIIAVLFTAIAMYFTAKNEIGDFFENPNYILLLLAAIYSLITNASIFWNVIKGNYKLSGGAVTHMGVALMLIGILFSSGYSKIVSLNRSGMNISNDPAFTKDDNQGNRENLILWYNSPQQMAQYALTYKGMRYEGRGLPNYLLPDEVEMIENDFHAIAMKDIVQNGKKYYSKGDSMLVFPENKYFEIEFRDKAGRIKTLYPRVQDNKKMGMAASPDLKQGMGGDLYTYVTEASNINEKEWSKTESYSIAPKDTFFLNDYIAVLESVKSLKTVEEVQLGPKDAALQANIQIMGKDFTQYTISPIFIIKDQQVAMPLVENKELGVRVKFENIDPQTGKFTFGINTSQRDFVVIKAIEKPLINVLWIGTFVLMIGFAMAIVRRYREFKLTRDKENIY